MPLRDITEAPTSVKPNDPVVELYANLPPRVEVANLVFDTRNKRVSKSGKDDEPLPLQPKEYDVLLYLAVCRLNSQSANKGRLFDHLYVDIEYPPEAKVIDVFVCKIRRCLEKKEAQCHIKTVCRRGYSLEAGLAPAKS
jgi:two-component system cell cycle response regulator CtrA